MVEKAEEDEMRRKESSISCDSQGELEDEHEIQEGDEDNFRFGGDGSAIKCNFDRKCQVCDKKFKTDSQLQQHCCSHFMKELKEEYGCYMSGLKCTICHSIFKKELALVVHIGGKHGKINDILLKNKMAVLPNPVTSKPNLRRQRQLIKIKNEERSGEVVRPPIIATPEQINRRISDKQQLLTPNSTTMQFLPPVSHSLPLCDGPVPPVASTSQLFVSGETDTQAVYAPTPNLFQAAWDTDPAGGRFQYVRPPHPQPDRPYLTRVLAPKGVSSQSVPQFSSRPLSPVVELDASSPRQACSSISPPLVSPADVTSITTIKHRSHSMPQTQFSSQSLPPVVELDVSPPHLTCPISSPRSMVLVSKQCSQGAPVGEERFLPHRYGLVNLPGITVTKCTPNQPLQIKLGHSPGEIIQSSSLASPTVTSDTTDLFLDMKSLMFDTKHSDVVLTCKGKKFNCHKAILGARSAVFRRMFDVDMEEATSGLVEINDVEPDIIDAMVEYIYTGKTTKQVEDLSKLVYVGDKYELKGLVEVCFQKFNISQDDDKLVVRMLFLADKHSLDKFKDLAMRKILMDKAKFISDKDFMSRIEKNPQILVEFFKV